jgi:TRAP transporter TAXI family solute receptor
MPFMAGTFFKKWREKMRLINKKAIVISVILAGLGTGAAMAASTQFMSIATGGTGGTYFILGSGMAKIIEKYVPNVRVSVESTAATIENVRLIAAKKVQFAIVMPDGAYFGYHGGREFKDAKYPNLRSVLAGHASPMHFMVRSNSGIKSWADLKGKRIAIAPPGSAARFLAESTLEAYGLTNKDYKPMFLSHTEQSDALRDGTIDMSCIFAGSPVAAVVDLSMTHDITFLHVGPEELKKVLQVHPYCTEFVIKAGTYKGQKTDVKTFATPSIIITHADVEPELVYAFTKAILEHTPELKEIHPSGAEFDLEDAATGVAIPLHPGAAKYLVEKGVLKK